jgi:hypothetical protein
MPLPLILKQEFPITIIAFREKLAWNINYLTQFNGKSNHGSSC